MPFWSALGEKSSTFKHSTARTGHIIDIPELGELHLYAAGFTHMATTGVNEGKSRQFVHQAFYELAEEYGCQDQFFPFRERLDIKISVERDEDNEHDPNAILIMAYTDDCTWELGFVPKKISDVVCKNLDHFRDGEVLKVTKEVHKKGYFSTKVCLKYSHKVKTSSYGRRMVAILG